MQKKIVSLLAVLAVGGCARAATPPAAPAPSSGSRPSPTSGPARTEGAGDSASRGGAGGASGAAAPRPYNRVITSDAITRRGMFAVHRVGDKLFFEIPRKEMRKDMLIVGRYSRAAAADAPPPPRPVRAVRGPPVGPRHPPRGRTGEVPSIACCNRPIAGDKVPAARRCEPTPTNRPVYPAVRYGPSARSDLPASTVPSAAYHPEASYRCSLSPRRRTSRSASTRGRRPAESLESASRKGSTWVRSPRAS